jgi:hypothetical protein
MELLNVALDPLTPDPLVFLAAAFAHLPDEAADLRPRRDEVLVRYHVAQADRSWRARAFRRAAAHAALAIAQRPALLAERRAWSLAARLLRQA